MAVQYLDGLEDAVVATDPQGIIHEGNPEFFRFVHSSRGALLGCSIAQVLQQVPALKPFTDAAMRLALDSVARQTLVELAMPEGPDKTLLVTAIPLRRPQGPRLTALRVEDITVMVRDRAEIEVRHLAALENARALERLNEELEGFSYSVAHDLRAPLRFIDKFAYLLVDRHAGELSPAGLQFAEQIREGSRQMAQLVEDLLEFSRVTGQALKRTSVDLNALARQVVEEVSRDLEGRSVAFTVNDLGVAQCDPVLILQVWRNLVSNAVKFTRGNASATITLSRDDSQCPPVFTVADNGVGFDSAVADRLFMVFQRFHQPDAYEGSGVGLAVVKRIVNRHGGVVWAESSVGKGARFHFTMEADSDHRSGEVHDGT